jgi:serpin B
MKRPALLLTLASLLLLAAGGPEYPTGEPPAELEVFVQGNTTFAFDLHRQLAQPGTNLFCSPYSLTSALALVQSGAHGQTEQQIAKTLRFPPPAEVQTALARIRQSFTNAGKREHIELAAATGLWAQRSYGFRNDFLLRAHEVFAAEVHCADFGSGSDALLAQPGRLCYFAIAPKTCCSSAVVRAAGLSRMSFSSSATILNRPSNALLVT